MEETRDKEQDLNPADFPDFPPTDESGEVDLSLIDYNLSLTVPERIRQHCEALKLVRRLETVRRQWYGPDDRDPEATD
jgi:hypothetical protein